LDKKSVFLIIVNLSSLSVLCSPAPESWEVEACKPSKLREQTRYTCKNGRIKCVPGWIGDLCQVAECGKNCDPQHGSCTEPGECKCNLGYTGESCRDCMKLPGCKNGYCRRSFECKCEDGWQGMFCNAPICSSCEATRGTCTGPDECTCKKGYKGEECLECATPEGCVNGFCTQPGECRCEDGWTGRLCDIPVCAHGCNGICSVPGECKCEIGWTGELCDVCAVYPGCANGVCSKPWQCNCLEGWTGESCETPTWTQGYRGGVCLPLGSFFCMNGGTELCNYWGNGTMVEKPRCLCPRGFTGDYCEYELEIAETTTQIIKINPTGPTTESVETIYPGTTISTIYPVTSDSNSVSSQVTTNPETYQDLGEQSSTPTERVSVSIPEVTVIDLSAQSDDNKWTPIVAVEQPAKETVELLNDENGFETEFWDPEKSSNKFIGSGRRTS